MDVAVEIDTAAFADAITSALPARGFTHRQLLYALMLGFGWCLGQDPERTTVMFWHMHHADWLFPSAEIERSNICPFPAWEGIDLVRPDRLILSIRNPVETLSSLVGLVSQQGLSPEQKERQFNIYLKLYVQDLARVSRIRAANIPVKIVRLEDIRQRTRETLTVIAQWLGVDAGDVALQKPSAFGHLWFGDIYISPTNAPKPQPPIVPLHSSDPDQALVRAVGAKVLRENGYESANAWARYSAEAALRLRQVRLRWANSVELRDEMTEDRRKFFRELK
jgi:hypothetical protein